MTIFILYETMNSHIHSHNVVFIRIFVKIEMLLRQSNYLNYLKKHILICYQLISCFRYIPFTKRSNPRSWFCWTFIISMGIMWSFIYDRCVMLCRIRNNDTKVWRWLCLHLWSIWTFTRLPISMGGKCNICVSFFFHIFHLTP